ncbi:hypothetical protein HMPREF3291_05210 [Bacillus sp. HMSC76G11]|nr:hypothetical protein HMPREF3291_05210 [Bacillus sp. HMSC76G11]
MIKKKPGKLKLEYVVNENECFEVISHKPGKNGYPQVVHKRTTSPAHRKIYEELFGEIEKGLCVRHKCDNRLCVNPEHLELGTFKDNMDDMRKRNRQAKGEQLGSATKLKEQQVIEIKSFLGGNKTDRETIIKLSEKYNVGLSTIYDIYYGYTWKHVVV